MNKHEQLACKYFTYGYNCAQSVFAAFHEEMGMDEKTALRLSSAFGGGMGRLREVCGAVSGAFLVLGYVRGYSDPKDYEGKKRLYSEIQEFAGIFKSEYGSIVCKELLAGVPYAEGSAPEKRSEEYYKKRPCPEQIEFAAKALHEFLLSHGEI